MTFRALQRARILRGLVERRFGVPALAVVVDVAEDAATPRRFDEETLVLGLRELRDATRLERWGSVWDLPGAAWDDGLARLGLLRALSAADPSGGDPDAFDLARRAEALGWPLLRPVRAGVGLTDDPAPYAEWRHRHAEPPAAVRVRVRALWDELLQAGHITLVDDRPRLTWSGGDVVLGLLEHLDGAEP